MRKSIIAALCLCLLGCAHLPTSMQKPYSEPQYGMTKIKLWALLGQPQEIEVYKKTDLDILEFDIYIRQDQSSPERIPIGLLNNKVIGWGKTFYEDHISSDDIRLK